MRLRDLGAALTALLAAGCGESPAAEDPTPTEPAPARATIDVDDPQTCASCHGAIVREWERSMHARAHHSRDPVYAAMRTLRMEREGEALAGRCAQCHSPRDTEALDSPVAQTGVACASCHAIAAVGEQGHGAARLTWAEDGTLRGPHDASGTAPHGVGPAAPWITDGQTLCLSCHGEMQNPQGAPTCTTGSEHAAAEQPRSCTSCHMPEVDGPSGAVSARRTHRSHAFLGPHGLFAASPTEADEAFMAGAVDVTASLEDPTPEGRTLRATLVNRAQHAVPSGFPGRMVLVRARAFDADGEVVFQSFTDAPMQQDPDAVLHRAYVDEAGQPTLPPYAARVARDTRLRPDETRAMTWEVPASAVRGEVELLYRLLPPPAVARLGLADDPAASPRRLVLARTEAPPDAE